MNKIIRISISIILTTGIIAVIYNSLLGTDLVNKNVKIELIITTDHPVDVDIFIQEDGIYRAEKRLTKSFGVEVTNQKLTYTVPKLTNPGKVRLDPGTSRGKWLLHSIKFIGIDETIKFTPDSIFKHFIPTKHIKDYKIVDGAVAFETTGPDPIFESDFSLSKYMPALQKRNLLDSKAFILALLIGLFALYFIYNRVNKLDIQKVTNAQALSLAFITILFLPFFKSTFFPNSKKEKNKYEEGAEKPNFSIENAIIYTKQYSWYFNQNFGYREDLIFLNSYYKYKLFGTSSKPDMVAVGKNKWLYFVNHSNWGDYQNINLFTEAELAKIKFNLEELHTWYKNRGIQFYVMLVPNKANIYPEYLPDYIKLKNKTSRIIQLRDYLIKNSFVHLIDVIPSLVKAKKNTEVYYQNDTHWNTQAGFIATQLALDTMKKSFPFIQVPNSDNYENVYINIGDPDLAKHLGLERVLQNWEWMPIKKNKALKKFIFVDSRTYFSQYILMPTITTEVPDTTLPKIVVYRDSFFGLLQNYFSESFRRCVYVWSTDVTKEVTDVEKPDIVLFEMIEGRIYKLLEENPEEIKTTMNPSLNE